MKRAAVVLVALVLFACGAPRSPEIAAPSADPATPAAEPAAEPAPVADPASSAAPPAAPDPAPPAASGPSKSAFVEANQMVMEAYPGPFDKTFKAVVAKLGEPKKKGENMNQWFALDGGKCVQFFMTKDKKKGHAASGISDADATDCK